MQAVLTPNRQVEVEIDPRDTVQVEPYFAKTRMRFQIQGPALTDVEQLASGIWILKPEATNLSVLHETTGGQLKALPLADYSSVLSVEQIPVQRSKTELTGVSPGPNVSASGDNFYIKRTPAASSWNLILTPRRPAPTIASLPTPNYPLDTVLQHSAGLDPSDQGYVVRWTLPAHPQEFIDVPFSFMFGGELTEDGYGQFELMFGGDGRAFLFEWIEDAWVQVDEWRFAPSELVPGMGHVCRIIPHAARYIEFRHNVTERGRPGHLLQNRRLTAFDGQSISLDAHVYEIANRGSLPAPGGGFARPVTGAGHPDFRVRRDVVLRWQLARVSYPATGTLVDQPFTIPQVDTSSHVLALRRFAMVYFNTLTNQPRGDVTASAANATTGAALTPASENWTLGPITTTLNGFTLPGKPNAIRVILTFTNSDGAGGTYSPWLFGYEAHKIGTNAQNDTTALLINGDHYRQSPVTRLSITGPDHDASHESASLRVADLVNRCSRLGTRGEGRIRVTTTDGEASNKAVLFDGYWIKSEGRRRGALGRAYPSPSWHDYDLTCLGMWKRLHERAFLAYEIMSFGETIEPNPPLFNGNKPPWKVTDAIRFLLVAVGWPESRLDIPDLPIRLWADGTREHDTVTIQPGTNALEFCQKLAEDYLNYYLQPDMNAGTQGMFRLRPLPRASDPAVWTFTMTPAGSGKLATHAASYASNTSWIAKDSLVEWVVPPEGNWIQASGEVDGKIFRCEANNPKAYNKPGQNTADPNHPDYTDGRWRPIYQRHDPTLLTREAVIFTIRRRFDLACRAQRFARFTCPLPLIDTATVSSSLYPVYQRRPLLFGDVVNYGDAGDKAMVRDCQMIVRKQHHMLARVTLQRFNDPLPA